MNHMEKTFSLVSKALNLADDPSAPLIQRPPLSDSEFRYYCDSVGQIINQVELRKVIFSGGIDPSLRRVVWKHILNVYPSGLTGKERMDYIKKKSAEYYNLRERWRTAVIEQGTNMSGELAYVTSMVRKDVLRTDRHHPFYAGNDDNQNVGALFNVLTTYALNHPSVSYCQGMSDMASPLLVTMCDEAQAYICFCGLMSRLKYNFMIDGIAMTKKFTHLTEALQFYDIEFYNYLKQQQADDLLFCYRWLLLEMKREFAFEDALRMLEIMWASLPIDEKVKEMPLFEREFDVTPIEPTPQSPSMIIPENPYTKICAIRRQNSTNSLSQIKLDAIKKQNLSLDEMKREERKSISKTHSSMDETKLMKASTQANEAAAKTESDEDDNSDDQNPFIYSDSTDADLPTGSDNSEVQSKPIMRGNSITETLRELREKLVASKIGIMNSIEQMEEDLDPLNQPSLKEVKLVKNFNEFLTFAKRSNSEEKPDDQQLTIDNDKRKSDPSPDEEYFPMTTSVTRGLKLEIDNLNRQVFGQNFQNQNNVLHEDGQETSPIRENEYENPYINLDQDIDAIEIDNTANSRVKMRKSKREANDETVAVNRFSVASSTNNDIFLWQNPLHVSSQNLGPSSSEQPTTPDEQADIDFDGEIISMDHGKKSVTPIRLVKKKSENQKRSNRNSTVIDDSDSDEEFDWNSRINSNNPFFEQIQKLQESPIHDDETELKTLTPMTASYDESSDKTLKNEPLLILTEDESAIKPEVQSVQPLLSPLFIKSTTRPTELPPPSEFGNGNPFLMFLCLTLLLQHRDSIMRSGMDYNETAMHFDKMVRKHNVLKCLNQARRLYQDYLRYHNEKAKNCKS